MKYLVDTHTLLWALGNPGQLPESVCKAIRSPENMIFASIAALWEIAIKVSIGKLKVPAGFLPGVQKAGYQVLPISVEHVQEYSKLPLHHRDPFDRIFVAQARIDDLTLITCDQALKSYRVPLLLYSR
jgi:PIN domain nuclease of toxin-antitoxin system